MAAKILSLLRWCCVHEQKEPTVLSTIFRYKNKNVTEKVICKIVPTNDREEKKGKLFIMTKYLLFKLYHYNQ